MISWVTAVVALVAVQRVAELAYARRNTARLLAAGAREAGARHYPLIVAVHVAWLVALVALVPADTVPGLLWLAVFIALQGGRVWVIASLGPYWTTRVIVPQGAPTVRRGPYRFLRHPNYVIVAAEIAVLPIAFGAWHIAVVFTLLNGLVLTHRIRVEDAARQPA